MKQIAAFEIINHGPENDQYFQGCGTAFTEYDHCATGCGSNAKEAYEDAVDSLAQTGWAVDTLPSRPRGIRARDKVPAKAVDFYWYVSIRVR